MTNGSYSDIIITGNVINTTLYNTQCYQGKISDTTYKRLNNVFGYFM